MEKRESVEWQGHTSLLFISLVMDWIGLNWIDQAEVMVGILEQTFI